MPLVTPEKIEEWVKEVEARPSSAPLIIEFIARRLQELSKRNEELLAENIALQSGKRVEEYERRVEHLEYQLDILKRRFGGERSTDAIQELADGSGLNVPAAAESISLLVYNAQGNVLRIEIGANVLSSNTLAAELRGEIGASGGEPVRLLAVPSSEELLFMYTSGRVAMLPVTSISATTLGTEIEFMRTVIPDEPRAGETLACLTPISKLAFVDFLLQVSRRGYLKKINASMSQSILANHYIGAGVKQAPDKTFSLSLALKNELCFLVTREGFLQCLEVKPLPVTVDEALRLETGDHLVAVLQAGPENSLLAATQAGKVIYVRQDQIEIATSFKVRGRPLFSAKRREMGARVVGAGAVREDDWGMALQQNGRLTLHAVQDLIGMGTVPADRELVAFATFSGAAWR